jgi:hypothetical protein
MRGGTFGTTTTGGVGRSGATESRGAIAHPASSATSDNEKKTRMETIFLE